MASIKQYSFDVFDTVLTRILARPADVFYYVRKKIQCNNQYPLFVRDKFVPIRIWSEFKSRRLVPGEDISLKKIYELIAKDYGLGSVEASSLLELELQVERECLVPISPVINRISELHEEGHKIIFVSDMYLSSEFIRSQLEKYGAFQDGDRLYVSGDLGITKGSGKLFRHLLENEELDPENLIHCGDNHHSDAEVPSKMGIQLDPLTRENGRNGCGFAPGLRAKFCYARTLLQARACLGINRVV